jgi:signal transduction histidine kinase
MSWRPAPRTFRSDSSTPIDDGLLMSVLGDTLEFLPGAALLVAPDGNCLANLHAVQLFRIGTGSQQTGAEDRLAGWAELRCADDEHHLAPDEYPFRRALAGESVVRDVLFDDPLTHEELAIRCIAQPVRLHDRIIGATVYCIDISDLRRSTERIRQTSQDLEQFSAIAAHDLQQPVRTICSYLELIRRHPTTRGELARLADFAEQGALRMRRLLTGLMDLTRANRQKARRQPVDCLGLLHEVIDNLAEEIREADADIIPGSLPAVEADRTLLLVLFQNLIGNAIKYRHPERRCSVLVEGKAGERETLFAVHDNGRGIGKEHLDEIFQPFRRLPVSGDLFGSGLGLDICRRIVAAHGGRIWAESTSGNGSSFFFTIATPSPSALERA